MDVAELPALRRALDDHITRIGELAGQVADLDGRAAEAEQQETEHREAAAEHRATARRYGDAAAAITLLGGTAAAAVAAGPADDVDPAPLSALLSRFEQADRDWTQVASNSVLAERLRAQTERAAAAGRRLAAYGADVLAEARRLLATAEGQDELRRGAALATARSALEGASGAVVLATSELEGARAEVRDAEGVRERERRPADLDVEPEDEAHARALAAEHATASGEASERVTALRQELDDAKRQAAEAERDAGLFDQRARRLQDGVRTAEAATGQAGAAAADVAPFAGDHAAAEQAVDDARDALTGTTNAAAASARRVDRAVQAVRKAAGASEFATIEDPLKERFTSDDATQLAARAAVRAADLRARREQILGLLADIGKDQELVVSQVAALVTDVLSTLTAAQRYSKLPGSLGEWSDQQFLTIKFTRPASEEDLRARIDAVVERVVAEGSKPEGLALLKRCVHEAVAPRGFTVTVLKPNSDLAVEPLDITLLGKYSGGEKLTVCIALYCTLARLRAVNRGRGHVGGTLVLDNPLGTASHVKLLRLQRDVAAAHGVQLVFTTGVEDLGAVGQFPNVVRLRNSPGTLRHRRYVTVESRGGSAFAGDEADDGADEGITGVRVTRLDEEAS